MQSLISASIINTAAGLGSLLTGFATTVLIARMLGADGTGHTAFALWLVFLAAVFADRGIPAMLMRYMRKVNGTERQGPLTRALYPRFIWSTGFLFVCFLAYAAWIWVANKEIGPSLWIVTGITFVLYVHGAIAIAAAQGLGHFTEAAKRTVVGSLLQVPAVFIGAFFFGEAGAMAGYLIRHLPQALGWRKYWSKEPVPADTVTEQMARYGRNSWISGIVTILVRTRIEFLFLGWFFSITEVGYFAIGMTFVSMVYQLALFMLAGLTPKFGGLHDSGNKAQLALTYQRALRWMSLLLLPISFGGAVVMPELIPAVFGSEFIPAVPVSILLVTFMFTQSLVLIPASALLAHEKDQLELMTSVGIGVLLVMFNLAITPFYGGEGAAIVRGIVNLGALIFLLWFVQRKLDLSAGVGGLLRITFAAVACAAVAYGVLAVMGGIIGLGLAIIAGALVYLVALRLFRAVPADDIYSLTTSFEHSLPAGIAKVAITAALWLRAPQPSN